MQGPGGPSSLNFVARKNEINKINQENNAFLQKLQSIKPAITDTRKLVKVMDNVSLLGVSCAVQQDSYKKFASNYAHGIHRVDPLVDRSIRRVSLRE